MRTCFITAIILLNIVITRAYAQQPYSETGLPLPRFVSLKSEKTHMRKGPGKRYPIYWVYKRKGLPVEIINEFGHWRQVRDHENITGWIHKNLLSGQRTAMINKEQQYLYRDPDETSNVLLLAKKGVIGDILECEVNWCKLQIKSRKGWVPKTSLWGVYTQEFID